MSHCRRFDVALRAHRMHLHDGTKQTTPCSVGERHSALQLRGAVQLHDRQMLTTGYVADRKIKSNAAPATNGRPRCSARGAMRPASSRFKPRREAGWFEIVVNLIRCSTIEGFAWPVAVVPIHEQRQLSPEAFAPVGDQEPARALTLDGPDEPLDDCDGRVTVEF